MRKNLETALNLTFGHEGGYSNAKTDKGNFLNGVLVGTKYGITGKTLANHRGVSAVTAQDVKSLTLAEAEDIYRKSYWGQVGGDILPDGLDYILFTAGVMSGPATAAKILQRDVLAFTGKSVDGIVGVGTVAAANRWAGGIPDLIRKYGDAYMAYLRSLRDSKTGFPVNGRGWTRRITGIDPEGKIRPQRGVIGEAIDIYDGSVPQPSASTPVDAAKAPPEPKKSTKDPLTYLTGATPVIGALIPAFNGNGPAQWGLGVALVLMAATGMYLLVKRNREAEA